MEKIVNIQWLRAVAAMMVVLYHANNVYLSLGGVAGHDLYSFFGRFGYAGVDVFFVISGYIIWVSTRKVSGGATLLGYLYNRAARIYLGYWPYFALFLLLAYLGSIALPPEADVLGSLFLSQSYWHKLLIDVSWTLQFELYFYAVFAVLLLLPRRHLIHAVWLIALVLLLLQCHYILIKDAYNPDHFYQQNMLFWFYGAPFCLEFLAGAVIAWFFERRRIKTLWPVVLGAVVAFVAALSFESQLATGSLAQGYYAPQRVLLFGNFAALSLSALIELERRGWVLFKRSSLLLGGASYSLYLAHAVWLYFFMRSSALATLQSWSLPPFIATTLLVLAMVLYSIIHYLWIEQTLMAWAARLKPKMWRGHNPKN